MAVGLSRCCSGGRIRIRVFLDGVQSEESSLGKGRLGDAVFVPPPPPCAGSEAQCLVHAKQVFHHRVTAPALDTVKILASQFPCL